jgi:hypothetical protein
MRANWNKVLTVVTVVARNANETAVEFGAHGMRAEALKKNIIGLICKDIAAVNINVQHRMSFKSTLTGHVVWVVMG